MSEKREKCDQCTTTVIAVTNGHLECLKYLVANYAAWFGHKKILEISLENNCPWHPLTTFYAAMNGHREILEFCVKNNCPWHPETTHIAAKYLRKECLEYIFENCKDFVSWEDSKLEEHMDEYSKEIREYVLNVKEEWQWYSNRGQDIKG